jgi:Ni/Fe-hydrogenase subunit HybB-like protein
LLPVLIVQAVLAGSAALSLFGWALPVGSEITFMLTIILLVAIALQGLLAAVEVFGSHANSHVAAAAHAMVSGPLRNIFWWLYVGVGTLLPLLLLLAGIFVPAARPVLAGLAGICALVGLFAYEHCFVVAGQAVPLS